MKKANNLPVNSGIWIQASMIFMLVFTLFVSSGCKKNEDTGPPDPPGLDDTTLFINASFRASHNSYCGNIDDGHRASIHQQLDAGLRFVEFDIHHSGTSFSVGHSGAGDAVDHSHGNPASNNLPDWVSVVATWSRNNQGHIPVILALDMKADFSKEELVRLNKLLSDTLGDRLFMSRDFKPSRRLNELAGRVMVVLSGNFDARERYSKFKNDSLKCFVEYQKGDPRLQGELFYAAKSPNCSWVHDERLKGKFVRLWDVTNGDCQKPAPNLPASNSPYFGWYARYCEDIHVVPDFGFSTVSWLAEQSHDKGFGVDCAVNSSGFIVEVHQSQNNPNELWYNTGKLSTDGKSIQWFSVSNSSRNYDTGDHPSVAINDAGIVVEVHGSENNNDLYYRTGTLEINTGVINWLQHKKHDEGEKPSAAINNDNMVVEVHQAPSSGELWYNVGKVDPDGTIIWGANAGYRNYTTGYSPSVALQGNQILEAHNSSEHYMWCIIGLLNPTEKKIDWKDAHGNNTYTYPCEEQESLYPDVALNAQSSVEVHRSTHGLWWRPGKTSNTVMAWGKSLQEASTYTEPSVAMNTNFVLMYYNDASDNLKYRLATIQ
ncbi:MAG: phosphatidylinositol-specific phospholipase C domain-containing protein [bacterium]